MTFLQLINSLLTPDPSLLSNLSFMIRKSLFVNLQFIRLRWLCLPPWRNVSYYCCIANHQWFVSIYLSTLPLMTNGMIAEVVGRRKQD